MLHAQNKPEAAAGKSLVFILAEKIFCCCIQDVFFPALPEKQKDYAATLTLQSKSQGSCWCLTRLSKLLRRAWKASLGRTLRPAGDAVPGGHGTIAWRDAQGKLVLMGQGWALPGVWQLKQELAGTAVLLRCDHSMVRAVQV